MCSLRRTRFVSLTSIQSLSTAKLKEKKPINDETSSTTMTSANISDIQKTYSEQIRRIVDEISRLSLMEVMDLNELLKVKIDTDRKSFIRSTEALFYL